MAENVCTPGYGVRGVKASMARQHDIAVRKYWCRTSTQPAALPPRAPQQSHQQPNVAAVVSRGKYQILGYGGKVWVRDLSLGFESFSCTISAILLLLFVPLHPPPRQLSAIISSTGLRREATFLSTPADLHRRPRLPCFPLTSSLFLDPDADLVLPNQCHFA